MSVSPDRADSPADLSLRARLLLALERRFPTVDAPVHGQEQAAYEYAKATGSYAPFVEAIGGLEGKTVLDFGCGWGGETAWLAERAERAVGTDIDASALDAARAFGRERAITNVTFEPCTDRTLPFEDGQFDAIFSTNVFEHVMRPTDMLREIRRVLKPGGAFVSTFGPLFYSPLGYHLPWATQAPFAHLVFGLRPMIEVRNLKRQPGIAVSTWEETGLNRITFAKFRAAVEASGLEAHRLRRLPVRGMTTLAKLPGVGDLFTFGIDCHLRRPVADAASRPAVRRAA